MHTHILEHVLHAVTCHKNKKRNKKKDKKRKALNCTVLKATKRRRECQKQWSCITRETQYKSVFKYTPLDFIWPNRNAQTKRRTFPSPKTPPAAADHTKSNMREDCALLSCGLKHQKHLFVYTFSAVYSWSRATWHRQHYLRFSTVKAEHSFASFLYK